jgi:hypothetical protein
MDGSWSSGMVALTVGDETFHGDSGPTVRALDAAFGDVIKAGHTASVENITQPIVCWQDDMGLVLGGFTPYNDWLEQGLPELKENEWAEVEIPGE